MKSIAKKILIAGMSMIMAFTMVPLLPAYANDIANDGNYQEETINEVQPEEGISGEPVDEVEITTEEDTIVEQPVDDEPQTIEICEEVQSTTYSLQKGAYRVKPEARPSMNTEGIYLVNATAVGKNKIKLKWSRQSGVKGYVVQRLKGKKWKTIKTLKGYKKTSYTNKGLKKGKYYQYRVKSFVYKKKGKKYKKVYSDYGIPVGAVAGKKKAKESNASKVYASTGILHVQNRNIASLTATPVGQYADRPLVNGSIRYVSSNPQIASVDGNGNVTGWHAGRCAIYSVAHNGIAAKTTVCVSLNPDVPATEIPILTFHRVVKDDIKNAYFGNDEWVASESSFEEQIKYLSDNNFNTISLEEFEQWYNGQINLPENSVAITIDDGNYENYYIQYPILKKYNVKATAFVVGSRTGSTTAAFENGPTAYSIGADKIAEIIADYPDFQFQSHSWDLHHNENGAHAIMSRTKGQIIDDCNTMVSNFGSKYMAYPYGCCTNYALAGVPKTGIRMAFGFGNYDYARRTNNRYNITRFKVSGYTTMAEFMNIVNRY